MQKRALENNPEGMYAENAMWKVNSDVVLIGASEAHHAYIPSIIQDGLGLSCYNCGADGNFFYYQNAEINVMLDRYSPRLIIWSVNPEFLSFDQKAFDRIGVLRPLSTNSAYCQNILRIQSKFEPIKNRLNMYSHNGKILKYILFGYLQGPRESILQGYKPLHNEDKKVNFLHLDYHTNADSICKSLFVNTLKRCRDNNVQVVLVFTPQFSEGDYTRSNSYCDLKNISVKMNIPLVEELFHDSTIMSPKYFKDANHLNDDGAEKFSSMLSELMISMDS